MSEPDISINLCFDAGGPEEVRLRLLTVCNALGDALRAEYGSHSDKVEELFKLYGEKYQSLSKSASMLLSQSAPIPVDAVTAHVTPVQESEKACFDVIALLCSIYGVSPQQVNDMMLRAIQAVLNNGGTTGDLSNAIATVCSLLPHMTGEAGVPQDSNEEVLNTKFSVALRSNDLCGVLECLLSPRAREVALRGGAGPSIAAAKGAASSALETGTPPPAFGVPYTSDTVTLDRERCCHCVLDYPEAMGKSAVFTFNGNALVVLSDGGRRLEEYTFFDLLRTQAVKQAEAQVALGFAHTVAGFSSLPPSGWSAPASSLYSASRHELVVVSTPLRRGTGWVCEVSAVDPVSPQALSPQQQQQQQQQQTRTRRCRLIIDAGSSAVLNSQLRFSCVADDELAVALSIKSVVECRSFCSVRTVPLTVLWAQPEVTLLFDESCKLTRAALINHDGLTRSTGGPSDQSGCRALFFPHTGGEGCQLGRISFAESFQCFCLECWVLPLSCAETMTVLTVGDRAAGELFLSLSATEGGVEWRGGARTPHLGATYTHAETTGRSAGAERWWHVALNFTGASWELWLDGVMVSSHASRLSACEIKGAPCVIGRSFAGFIAEVRVWERCRSAAELTRDRHRPLSGRESGLRGYFPLREQQGDVLVDLSPQQEHRRFAPGHLVWATVDTAPMHTAAAVTASPTVTTERPPGTIVDFVPASVAEVEGENFFFCLSPHTYCIATQHRDRVTVYHYSRHRHRDNIVARDPALRALVSQTTYILPDNDYTLRGLAYCPASGRVECCAVHKQNARLLLLWSSADRASFDAHTVALSSISSSSPYSGCCSVWDSGCAVLSHLGGCAERILADAHAGATGGDAAGVAPAMLERGSSGQSLVLLPLLLKLAHQILDSLVATSARADTTEGLLRHVCTLLRYHLLRLRESDGHNASSSAAPGRLIAPPFSTPAEFLSASASCSSRDVCQPGTISNDNPTALRDAIVGFALRLAQDAEVEDGTANGTPQRRVATTAEVGQAVLTTCVACFLDEEQRVACVQSLGGARRHALEGALLRAVMGYYETPVACARLMSHTGRARALYAALMQETSFQLDVAVRASDFAPLRRACNCLRVLQEVLLGVLIGGTTEQLSAETTAFGEEYVMTMFVVCEKTIETVRRASSGSKPLLHQGAVRSLEDSPVGILLPFLTRALPLLGDTVLSHCAKAMHSTRDALVALLHSSALAAPGAADGTGSGHSDPVSAGKPLEFARRPVAGSVAFAGAGSTASPRQQTQQPPLALASPRWVTDLTQSLTFSLCLTGCKLLLSSSPSSSSGDAAASTPPALSPEYVALLRAGLRKSGTERDLLLRNLQRGVGPVGKAFAALQRTGNNALRVARDEKLQQLERHVAAALCAMVVTTADLKTDPEGALQSIYPHVLQIRTWVLSERQVDAGIIDVVETRASFLAQFEACRPDVAVTAVFVPTRARLSSSTGSSGTSAGLSQHPLLLPNRRRGGAGREASTNHKWRAAFKNWRAMQLLKTLKSAQSEQTGAASDVMATVVSFLRSAVSPAALTDMVTSKAEKAEFRLSGLMLLKNLVEECRVDTALARKLLPAMAKHLCAWHYSDDVESSSNELMFRLHSAYFQLFDVVVDGFRSSMSPGGSSAALPWSHLLVALFTSNFRPIDFGKISADSVAALGALLKPTNVSRHSGEWPLRRRLNGDLPRHLRAATFSTARAAISLRVDREGVVVHSGDGCGSVVAAEADWSSAFPSYTYYYEVTVVDLDPTAVCCVGVGPEDYSLSRMPGGDPGSYAAQSGTDALLNGDFPGARLDGFTFGQGDVVGCGWSVDKNRLYWTRNGRVMAHMEGPSDAAAAAESGRHLFPIVGLDGKGVVTVNFGRDVFVANHFRELHASYTRGVRWQEVQMNSWDAFKLFSLRVATACCAQLRTSVAAAPSGSAATPDDSARAALDCLGYCFDVLAGLLERVNTGKRMLLSLDTVATHCGNMALALAAAPSAAAVAQTVGVANALEALARSPDVHDTDRVLTSWYLVMHLRPPAPTAADTSSPSSCTQSPLLSTLLAKAEVLFPDLTAYSAPELALPISSAASALVRNDGGGGGGGRDQWQALRLLQRINGLDPFFSASASVSAANSTSPETNSDDGVEIGRRHSWGAELHLWLMGALEFTAQPSSPTSGSSSGTDHQRQRLLLALSILADGTRTMVPGDVVEVQCTQHTRVTGVLQRFCADNDICEVAVSNGATRTVSTASLHLPSTEDEHEYFPQRDCANHAQQAAAVAAVAEKFFAATTTKDDHVLAAALLPVLFRCVHRGLCAPPTDTNTFRRLEVFTVALESITHHGAALSLWRTEKALLQHCLGVGVAVSDADRRARFVGAVIDASPLSPKLEDTFTAYGDLLYPGDGDRYHHYHGGGSRHMNHLITDGAQMEDEFTGIGGARGGGPANGDGAISDLGGRISHLFGFTDDPDELLPTEDGDSDVEGDDGDEDDGDEDVDDLDDDDDDDEEETEDDDAAGMNRHEDDDTDAMSVSEPSSGSFTSLSSTASSERDSDDRPTPPPGRSGVSGRLRGRSSLFGDGYSGRGSRDADIFMGDANDDGRRDETRGFTRAQGFSADSERRSRTRSLADGIFPTDGEGGEASADLRRPRWIAVSATRGVPGSDVVLTGSPLLHDSLRFDGRGLLSCVAAPTSNAGRQQQQHGIGSVFTVDVAVRFDDIGVDQTLLFSRVSASGAALGQRRASGGSALALVARVAGSILEFGYVDLAPRHSGRGVGGTPTRTPLPPLCRVALTKRAQTDFVRLTFSQTPQLTLLLHRDGTLVSKSSIASLSARRLSLLASELCIGGQRTPAPVSTASGTPECSRFFTGDVRGLRVYDSLVPPSSMKRLADVAAAGFAETSLCVLLMASSITGGDDGGSYEFCNAATSERAAPLVVTVHGRGGADAAVGVLETGTRYVPNRSALLTEPSVMEVDFSGEGESTDLFRLSTAKVFTVVGQVLSKWSHLARAPTSAVLDGYRSCCKFLAGYYATCLCTLPLLPDVIGGGNGGEEAGKPKPQRALLLPLHRRVIARLLRVATHSEDAVLARQLQDALLAGSNSDSLRTTVLSALLDLSTAETSSRLFESTHPMKQASRILHDFQATDETYFELYFDSRGFSSNLILSLAHDKGTASVIFQSPSYALFPCEIRLPRMMFIIRNDAPGPQWGYRFNVLFRNRPQLLAIRSLRMVLYRTLRPTLPDGGHSGTAVDAADSLSLLNDLCATIANNAGKTRRIALSCVCSLLLYFHAAYAGGVGAGDVTSARVLPPQLFTRLHELKRMAERHSRRRTPLLPAVHSRFVQAVTETYTLWQDISRQVDTPADVKVHTPTVGAAPKSVESLHPAPLPRPPSTAASAADASAPAIASGTAAATIDNTAERESFIRFRRRQRERANQQQHGRGGAQLPHLMAPHPMPLQHHQLLQQPSPSHQQHTAVVVVARGGGGSGGPGGANDPVEIRKIVEPHNMQVEWNHEGICTLRACESPLFASTAITIGSAPLSQGRWYFELRCARHGDFCVGVSAAKPPAGAVGFLAGGIVAFNGRSGTFFVHDSLGGASAEELPQSTGLRAHMWSHRDVVGVVLDMDAQTCQLRVNGEDAGSSFSFGDLDARAAIAAAAAAAEHDSGQFYPFIALQAGGELVQLNCGGAQFEYQVPRGCAPLDPTNYSLGSVLPLSQLRAFQDLAAHVLTRGAYGIPPFFFEEASPFAGSKDRVGPPHVSLLPSPDVVINGLEVKNTGVEFRTVRADSGVRGGAWFFEVTLRSQGLMQIGWVISETYQEGQSVGDTDTSWSIDLFRRVRWHGGECEGVSSSRRWSVGDVVGCALDLTQQRMAFYFNGRLMGSGALGSRTYSSVPNLGATYVPAVSLRSGNAVELNFGSSPFKHKPDGFAALGVPDSWNERIEAFYINESAAHTRARLATTRSLWLRPARQCSSSSSTAAGLCNDDDDTSATAATAAAAAASAGPLQEYKAVLDLVSACERDTGKSYSRLTDAELRRLLSSSSSAEDPHEAPQQVQQEHWERFHVLKALARVTQGILPFLFIDTEYPSGLASLFLQIRYTLFPSLRTSVTATLLKDTATRSEQYRLFINRRRAAQSRAALTTPAADGTGRMHADVPSTIFGQTLSLLEGKHPSIFQTNRRFWHTALIGEGAEDVGGPFREHLNELCAELMSPALPLFVPSANHVHNVGTHREAYVPSAAAAADPRHDAAFRFVGRLMGGALRCEEPLSLFFPPLVWKRLCRCPVTVADLAAVDLILAQLLEDLRAMPHMPDGRAAFEAVFEEEVLTARRSDGSVVELAPNGAATAVTFEGCDAYRAALQEARLHEFDAALEKMRAGMLEVVPELVLLLLTPEELERRVCGQPDYDAEELRHSAIFEGLAADDRRVLLLWEVLASCTPLQRRQFLRFVSGRERLPVKLRVLPLNVPGDPDAVLPRAATCFFALELPDYSSLDVMRARLIYSIENCTDMDTDFVAQPTDGNDAPRLSLSLDGERLDAGVTPGAGGGGGGGAGGGGGGGGE